MSDKVHTHETIGLRPVGECAACDQVRRDLVAKPRRRDIVNSQL